MAGFSNRLFARYLALPYAWHLERDLGSVIRNLTATVPAAFQGFRFALNLALEALLAAGAIAVLLLIEPAITVAVAALAAAAIFATYRFITPHLRDWGAENNALSAASICTVTQGLGAIKDVKIRRGEGHVAATFAKLIDRVSRLVLYANVTSESPRFAIEIAAVAGFAGSIALIAAAGRPVENALVVIGLFGMAALRLLPSANRILNNAGQLRYLDTHIDLLVRDIQADRPESPETVPSGGGIPFRRDILFENVSFRYRSGAAPALTGLDLRIAKGEKIGLVGPSGAGKSTLVDLMMGLLEPTSGRILADGADISTQRRAWRGRFGYVPQDVYLLDDTIRRNVAFGANDASIDDAKVFEAVRRAHFSGVLERLPQGLDTVLGERGSRLSGGERQRIGIARALYGDPEILVFDEATSALDNESEFEIKRAIAELPPDKTTVVIAHRLSTVRQCDRLVFLKDSRIAAIGDFATLERENADFRRLVEIGEISAETPGALRTDP
jgi:ATP-binding cassette subfamily C protein